MIRDPCPPPRERLSQTSLVIDCRYAIDQIERMLVTRNPVAARDCANRARDALERLRGRLEGQP